VVVLVATPVSLNLVIRGMLAVPSDGSVAMLLVATSLHLSATTAMGILMATLARTGRPGRAGRERHPGKRVSPFGSWGIHDSLGDGNDETA